MAITEVIDADRFRESPNLTEAVYEMLIDLLIRGELRPGDVIIERKMAERLNASRTPVREALGRLESEGLVFKQAGRGVTVSPFSTEAFVEILNVRQLLEGEAARLAAGEISDVRLTQIREVQVRLAANPAPGLAEIWEADDLLHGTIADASGNKLMVSMIRDLRRRTHVFNSFRSPATYAQHGGDNAQLLDALERGDREAARAAMWAHIETVKIALVDRLAGRARC